MQIVSSQFGETMKQKQFYMRDYQRLKKDLNFMNEFNRETMLIGKLQSTQKISVKEALSQTRKIAKSSQEQERSASKSPKP